MTRMRKGVVLAVSIFGASFGGARAQGAHGGAGFESFQLYSHDPDDQMDAGYWAFASCDGRCGSGCGAGGDCLPIKTLSPPTVNICSPPPCDFGRALLTVHAATTSTSSTDTQPKIETVGDKQLKVSGVTHFIVMRVPIKKAKERSKAAKEAAKRPKAPLKFKTVPIEKPEDWNVDAKEGTVTLVFLPTYKVVDGRWTLMEPKDKPQPPKRLRLVKLAPSNIEWKSQ
jgi:hypothetical protein